MMDVRSVEAASWQAAGLSYFAYNFHLRNKFGERVQKVSVDAGFTCPNVDGTVAIGGSNQILYYLLEWSSLAEREEKWAAFQSNPEWQAKRAESERDGPIVAKITNEILQPTSFSSVR